jgi:hypothetical protein
MKFRDSIQVKAVFYDKVAQRYQKMAKFYLIGNKIDLMHLRKVDDAMHNNFISQHKLEGGFHMSARSGDNVLTVFYKVAAAVAGITLSDYELAFTKKVLKIHMPAVQTADDGMLDADERQRQGLLFFFLSPSLPIFM